MPDVNLAPNALELMECRNAAMKTNVTRKSQTKVFKMFDFEKKQYLLRPSCFKKLFAHKLLRYYHLHNEITILI